MTSNSKGSGNLPRLKNESVFYCKWQGLVSILMTKVLAVCSDVGRYYFEIGDLGKNAISLRESIHL